MIDLSKRRFRRSKPRPVAGERCYLDLADPDGYLVADRLERARPEVRLRLACARHVEGSAAVDGRARRTSRVGARAADLRVPLALPEAFGGDVGAAQRAGSYAIACGRGNRFLFAALRLAYGGGYDLRSPDVLAEAAAAAGLGLDATLAAARDPRWEAPIVATSQMLRAAGAQRLPVLQAAGRFVWGEEPISAYLALTGPPAPRAGAF